GFVDVSTFGQILDMDDDDDDREFSRGIVFDFFDQANQTFAKMDTALEAEDFNELKELGHFLKGSSATLGLVKVRDSCEKIQHYGDKKDTSGTIDEPDERLLLSQLDKTIASAKQEFTEVEKELRKFYSDSA
ncbi:histidine-phosphotransfer domain, HPT domain-containing protein, partial [Microthyrium microscopicum]